ncbi:MAG: hypothetical protein SFW66_03830 [Gammaproteobacteria bacterium]|nr:hypothetical protein [Gammaproteobacteria bacterium]
MHLIIYFAGTGEEGSDFSDYYNYVDNQKVKALLVTGCHDKEVCNATINPNLKRFATRFTKSLFVVKDRKLHLSSVDFPELKVGIRICNNMPGADDIQNEISGITLCGYSRGAVTCFETARQLNKIIPNIPVDIIANQPTPGNLYTGPGTNAHSIADCRSIGNIRRVAIILGAYTGEYHWANKIGTVIHRTFYSQIIPQLSLQVSRSITVIQRNNHHEKSVRLEGTTHFHMYLSHFLHLDGYLEEEKASEQRNKIKTGYKKYQYPSFPKINNLQDFYGMAKKDIYHYLDKQHRAPDARAGMKWDAGKESLLDWWNKHEKDASRTSSPLTKLLVKRIQNTNGTSESLIELFIEADKWLIEKRDTASSRYDQVEALRNNICRHLIARDSQYNVILHQLHDYLLKTTHYLKKHWNHIRHSASFFKSDATRQLDTTFSAYDQGEITDQALIQALSTWLSEKTAVKSKRYNAVYEMREQLLQMKENQEKQYPLFGLHL